MSAHPQQSTPLSSTAAAEPAAAASSPAAGSKRRSSDDAAPTVVEHQQPAVSSMDDTPRSLVGSSSAPSPMEWAADQQSPTPARKEQRLAQSNAAVPAVTAPPWSSMYSDALHSIFKFTRLPDLARLMSVSRRWGEAVTTMPPLSFPAFISNASHFDCLLNSRVRRHVTALFQSGVQKDEPYLLSVVHLQRVSVQVPWLLEVAAMVATADDRLVSEALPRFTKLRHLDLELHSFRRDVSCNSIIQTIGGLNPATMRTLTLVLPHVTQVHQLSFAPLAALTQLQLFTFSVSHRQTPLPLTDAQIHDLRAMTSLQKLTTPYKDEAETDYLVRVLQPDHALQQASFGWVQVTAPLATVLGSFLTLTTLHTEMRCTDVQFFAQLSRLTELDFGCREARVDPAALASSLRHCSHLTRLRLTRVDLASRHMEELLSAFPHLSNLSLSGLNELESLRCFIAPSLAVSLTSLTLHELPRCLPSELSHVFGLQSLLSVDVNGLALPLTGEDKAAFRVPSQVFPALQSSSLV